MHSIWRKAWRICSRRPGASTKGASALAADTQILITSDKDVVTARQQGRAVALQAGFAGSEATLIATPISELARTIVSDPDQGSGPPKPVHGATRTTRRTIAPSPSGPRPTRRTP